MKRQTLKRAADQLEEALKEKLDMAEISRAKQKAHLKDYVLTGLLLKTKMAKTAEELHDKLGDVDKQRLGKTATRDAKMQYLKLQRKFLLHLGVPKKVTPVLSYAVGKKKRKDYTPAKFANLLGTVLTNFKAGNLDGQLKLSKPAAMQPTVLRAFRGATPTPRLTKLLAEQKQMLDDLREEVQQEVESRVTVQVTGAGARKKKRQGTSKRTSPLKSGTTVWVADIDEADPDGSEQTWEAKVVRRMPKAEIPKGEDGEWYDLDFG